MFILQWPTDVLSTITSVSNTTRCVSMCCRHPFMRKVSNSSVEFVVLAKLHSTTTARRTTRGEQTH